MDDDAGRPSLLDVVCYAPLGLAQVASEELPKLARQRRQAVENRIVLARWIGQIAVQQVEREIRKRWAASHPPASTTPASTETVDVTGSSGSLDEVVSVGWSADAPPLVEPPAPAVTAPEPAMATAMTDDAVPAADELPIAGYESLAAQQVVQRLATLTSAERDAIRRFETAHRHRRTILAKLEQLQAG